MYDTAPIMLTDSYKLSHFNQYPPNMAAMQSYLESRGGEYNAIPFFGLKYYVDNYLDTILDIDVEEADFFAKMHGVSFNRGGFNYISELGYWPVKIIAKPEGTICRPNDVLMTIESTDENVPWVANYLETLLMKVWYPCTVAAKAYHVHKIIEKQYDSIGADKVGIDFVYHNFGDRGSTSVEAAALGGIAHLTSFKGTDNFNCLRLACNLYGDETGVGFSIPATEHSTVTSWGKTDEYVMIAKYLENYKNSPIIACVLDSYNIFSAVDFVTSHLKAKIESPEYPIFVIRPDSGNPLDVIPSLLSIMEVNNVGYSVHEHRGREYRLFNKYRIIWGDGIDPQTIDNILSLVISLGYSPANFAFGSGGDLMQKVDRDTCKFAIKCCAVKFKGEDKFRSVGKEPLHDGFKKSKMGYQTVENGIVYYDNGFRAKSESFEEVRARVRAGIR